MADPPPRAIPLPDLPVRDALDRLRTTLSDRRRAILVAPPGSGKTTVVPLALLSEPWLAGRIVMLEPRRLATRAAARRMAVTTSTPVGDLVGYQTRDERHIGPATRIEVVTEGILTRRIQRAPELDGIGLVIFDEVHERHLPTDLGLALLLDVVSSIRPDLRILAMSATPDVDRLAAYLDADVVTSDGRDFDVEVRWTPPPQPGARGSATARRPGGRGRPATRGASATNARELAPHVATTILRALRDDPGDALVFLPGVGEIRDVAARIEPVVGRDVDVHQLAGALSTDEQDDALAAAPPGRRKVVLSTDIAESSLTVDGVRIVIDSGLGREPRLDPRTGMSRLTTVVSSRASADQRAGRAGRTSPGVAYRLWSKLEHGVRPAHRTAEIVHADLAGLALELAAWGSSASLRFLDPPPRAAYDQARELLTDLHALDGAGAITALGRTMLQLPFHPRLARMIAIDESMLSCVVATLLDERDVFRGRPDDLPTDLTERVEVIAGALHSPLADRHAVRRARQRSLDAARRAGIDGSLDEVHADRAGAVLLLAYPDRLAAQRRRGQFLLRNGSGAWVPDADPLASEPFVVAADLDGRRDRARIRLAAPVELAAVLAVFGDEVVEHRTLRWDTDRDDLVETIDRTLGAIQLGVTTRPPNASDETTAALVGRVRSTNLDALGWSDAATHLRDRVGFLRRRFGTPWPDWSTVALTTALEDWLGPFLGGATSARDLRRIDLVPVLRSQLPWPEGAELDSLAPPTWPLPTGTSARIDYHGDVPECAVRVQDVFGVTEHPVAAGHRIRLHLLSPADRPIQITADLPAFWAGSWSEVRKEMAGRYPKHFWPTDPATARPRRLRDDS